MDKNNGFTLVELLSVVIILALTFMFVAPKMASIIKEGNNTEVKLIEQKALVSAKNYVNNYDTNFLNNFIEVGHTKTVYKQDLIDNGLMTLDEINQLEDFRGVQVKLLENDKLEYTISRLGSSSNYTNEELYDMIEALRTQVSSSNIFLKSYPVGSVYISTSSKNPGSTYGGTWVEYGKGKTLVGVDSSDTDFNTVEKIGGEKIHSHKYGLQYGSYYADIMITNNNDAGLINYSPSNSFSVTGGGTEIGDYSHYVNGNNGESWVTKLSDHYRMIAQSEYVSTLQPYITVYMWKRTA